MIASLIRMKLFSSITLVFWYFSIVNIPKSSQSFIVSSRVSSKSNSLVHSSYAKKKELDTDEDSKSAALAGVLSQIERSYGKGSIQKLGESKDVEIEKSPTGSMTLDVALGGGYPRGRVIEIYGQESTGKTTLALHAVAEIQKNGGDFNCVFA